MHTIFDDIDPLEKHYSVQELQQWLAGAGSDEHRAQISRHLSQCDMCMDSLQGLLEFDSQDGIKQREDKLNRDFYNKNLRKKKRSLLGSIKLLSTQNIALLILAIILFLTLIFAIIFMSNKGNKSSQNTSSESSSDNYYSDHYYPVSRDSVDEDFMDYPDTSGDYEDIIDYINSDDKNIDYSYYNPTESNYNPYQYYDNTPIYQRKNPTQESEDVTNYANKGAIQDGGSITPENEYFGYNSKNVVPSTQPSEMIQIGNNLINLNNIIDQAENYYNSGNYKQCIQYLKKYESELDEPIDDMDYWIAKSYIALGDKDDAKPYLERLAGYNNPYQSEAKKLLL